MQTSVKTSPWHKPVEEIGGINALIQDNIRKLDVHGILGNGSFPCEIRVHAYREVGTALEVSLETRTDILGDMYFEFHRIFLMA